MTIQTLKANELCLDLLESYPADEFVRVTLSASTTLASATLINVPAQVTLLLRYLLEDPRSSIKTHALQLLHSLAKKGAHLWPQGALEQLIGNIFNFKFKYIFTTFKLIFLNFSR